MLTIKAEVQQDKQRSDGTYNVKIRFTLDRKVKRLSTSLFVTSKELTKSFKFKEDTPIKKEIDNLLFYYKEQCCKLQLDQNDYTLENIFDFLNGEQEKKQTIDFIKFSREWITSTTIKGAPNYTTAVNALVRFIGKEELKGQRKILRGISDKILSLCETNESSAIMETNGYRLLLPEGTLDYFNISAVKESSSEIVIYLEEKNELPGEYSTVKVESKGFYDPVVVRDFPIRGKNLFLNIRRRRWILKDEGRYVSRNWKLVAEGSRMTHEFASFLKELY